MKKIFTLIALFLLTVNVVAQAPQKMSFQAVIRNSNDALVSNAKVGMKISILQGSASGTVVYSETQSVKANKNGLVTLEIGNGSVTLGTFTSINWANGPYFIKTETDPTGGTSYTISGTSELMSVPYALFSANGTPGPQGPIGLTGPTGPQGPIGLTGAVGATGPQGVQGPLGLTGAAGVAGINGTNGIDGATGPQGIAGTNGVDGLTTSVNGVTQVLGAITLAKSDIGLGNVDNTADINKPISMATLTALDLKVDKVAGERLINANEIATLSNLSGTNTGDQDISGIATNTTAIATEVTDRTNADLLKEDLANKSTDVITDGSSDTKYPSVKSVKTYVDASTSTGSTALAAEVTRATAAEGVLTTNLTSEETARIAGDATNATAITALQTEQTTQNDAIALNTAKVGISPAQATAITTNTADIATIQTEQVTQNDAISLNTAKVGISPAQATAITTNTADIATVQAEQVTQNSAIALNTAKVGITPAQASTIAATSGTNTGDQDISGIATNATAITALQTEQTTQNSAIALNTAKVGITPAQATAITTNTADIATIQAEQVTQNSAIALNTAKVGITPAQASTIAATSGTNTGDQDISGIATNATAITALQTEQVTQNDAIALNTAKVGITVAQAATIAATTGTNTGDQIISGTAPITTSISGVTTTLGITRNNIVAGTSSNIATTPLVLDAGANNAVVGGANATLTVNNTAPLWNTNQLQGKNVATTTPTDGQVLTWDATTSTWKPAGYTVVTVAGTTYTLSASDHGKILDFTSSSAITLTIPAALTTGFQVSITQAGTGQITFTGSGAMIVNNRWSGTKTSGRWAKAGIEVRATNSAVLSGDVQ